MNPEQAMALLKLIADLYNVINTAATSVPSKEPAMKQSSQEWNSDA